MTEEISSDSPDPLTPLTPGWKNNECISPLNNYSQTLTEPVKFPELTRCFNQPIAFKMALLDPPYTPLVWTEWAQTNMLLQKAAYVLRLRSCAHFTSVSAPIAELFMCNPSEKIYTRAIPNQTLTPTEREDCYTIRTCSSPLSNSGGSRTDDRPAFCNSLLIMSFIS